MTLDGTMLDRPRRPEQPAGPTHTRTSTDTSTPVRPARTIRALVDRSAEAVAARLAPAWSDRRIGGAIALLVVVVWAAVAAGWTPRGPLTTAEAVWSIVLSALVGFGAGLLSHSRSSMLFAPLTFVIVFELGRLGLDGPTVDAPHLSTYGIMALAVGRGIHGLLALLPMIVGVAVGAGTARGLDTATSSRGFSTIARRTVTIATATSLVALSALLMQPARTDPITDADGNVLPNSVAELDSIEVNGHELALMIRGHDVDNPVLLFLAGGPGGSELGAMRNHLAELEEHVTVVTWDQRGAGKSYPALDPTSTIALDDYVADTLAVTDHLRERFDQDRIYLLGQSWGSTLGVLAAQRSPDRFVAFIGTGQMVSQRATDRIFYDDTMAWAEMNGEDGLVDELQTVGPPPYDEMFPYETALSHEHEVYPYDRAPNREGEGGFSENFIVPEYTLLEKAHLLGAFMDTFAALYPQLQDIDFRATATEFEIPMYFVQGAHEAAGRAEPFEEWYPLIEAPDKDRITLATSGHRPLWEQPDEFVDYMVDTVLDRTHG